jgi:hypothetical protein
MQAFVWAGSLRLFVSLFVLVQPGTITSFFVFCLIFQWSTWPCNFSRVYSNSFVYANLEIPEVRRSGCDGWIILHVVT